eukprot:CAMPEP_0119101778 /NCGR_PEP_ID=MMETSP1180-20130426/731_1 /TAXON_ID=3052 ORGANISM="Chlamydomonas cf sp, Strain CCMP681" /NCGR_SAMPLE_ID=MMETSP1180 /ASSEMBLY_ACC=CAM_ASM_000741 /LENGTH=286 /DNA_ID=CAMNT_0007085951 /DNA_START=112 /DNA_END=972 /DNA_ORIENTATION=+
MAAMLTRPAAPGSLRTTQGARSANLRRPVVARASSQQDNGLLRFSKSIGLDASEGVFGFTPFAENWAGRLAMMGFITSIAEEFVTGKGTLAQINLMESNMGPNYPVLAALCVIFGGATTFGIFDTLNKLRNNKLPARSIARYKNFLALDKEGAEREEARRMKAEGDFTTPGDNLSAVAASKAAGSAADAFLSTNDLQEGSAASSEMKSSKQAAAQAANTQQRIEDAIVYDQDDMRYAREVELRNGRYAMIGFLAAILVEAGTGHGILQQVVDFLKFTGALGPDSGF